MPNYCNYSMKIQGTPENVDEFVKIMKTNYAYDENGKCYNPDDNSIVERHLWRVFDANSYEGSIENGIKTVDIDGYCAWSVYSCMCDGPHTYQSSNKECSGTTLELKSERLGLVIEVFSEEPGIGFMEHMVFVKGDEIVNDCVDYVEYCTEDFDTLDEMNRVCGTNFTEKQFEEKRIMIGGMDWNFSDWTYALIESEEK